MIAPKALIFDCDGTLALTADLHFTAFQAALALQGHAMTRDWYASRTGLARHDLIAALQAESSLPLDVDRAVADSIALTLTGTQVCRPNPPVADLARRWQGHPIAVASNAEAPVVDAVLRACGLRGLFGLVITLTEAGRAKPDPTMFLMAARDLGHDPADCLVLEDSAQGMEAARRAGIPALDVREPEALAQLARLAPQDFARNSKPAL